MLQIFDARNNEKKIEEHTEQLKKEKTNAQYIKNLRLEPIDICFTFRSSPGESLNTSLKNVFSDLGLTLASID
jgi:hypothetical protein